jgi:hypothetical protein
MMRKITPKQDNYMIGSGPGKPLKNGKSNPIYPKFNIGLEHLPEAKNMKLGEHAHIQIHGKLSRLSQGGYDNSAEFEIHGISHKKTHKGDDEEAEESPDNEKAEGEEADAKE